VPSAKCQVPSANVECGYHSGPSVLVIKLKVQIAWAEATGQSFFLTVSIERHTQSQPRIDEGSVSTSAVALFKAS
ncbi:hypothetical protein AD949_04145, partial [Acetobacter orleanensis]